MLINNLDTEDMVKYLRHAQPAIIQNTKIIVPEQLVDGCLYHISTRRPSEGNLTTYIPQMPRRAANSEDNTLPRVTVAPTIEGCMVGYNTLSYLAETPNTREKDIKKLKDPYLGGLYIYRIPFEVCLKPNKELVFDATFSNECWLVPYRHDRLTYTGECIGKLFPVNKFKRIWENDRTEVISFVCELIKDPVTMSNATGKQNAGYYKLDFVGNRSIYNVQSITEAQYLQYKGQSANLLDYKPLTGKKSFSTW